MKYIRILFIVVSLISWTAWADGIVLSSEKDFIDIGRHAYIISDSSGPRTIDTLLKEIRDRGLANIPRSAFSGEHISYNAWVLFTLKNESDSTNWILEYDYERTGKQITLYEIENGNAVRLHNDGFHVPWDQKDLPHRNPAFRLFLDRGETRHYCILFSKPEDRPFLTDLQIKLKLWPLREFIGKAAAEHLFFGILLGIIIVMGLYNLILFVYLRQWGYFYYSLFIFFLGMMQLNTYGIISKAFPTSLNIDFIISTFFPSLQGVAYVLFSASLLRLHERYPRTAFLLIWSSLLMPLFSFMFQIWNILFVMDIRNILLLLYLLSIIFLSVRIALKGDRPAKIFLTSNCIFLLFAVIGVFMQMGILPFITLLYHSMDIGMILMIVLFSLALGDEIKAIRHDKEKAKLESTAKTMFLANMSHEMRTPLNGIIGFTELVQNSSDLEEIHRHNVLIRRESNRLLFLISQLLDLSKAETGKISLNIRPFSISALLNSLESSFTQRVEQNNLKLSTHVDMENVNEWYEGDPDRIEQILVNLVGNALKFTDQGTIRIEVTRESERIRFSVADTGIGIKEQDRGRIFGAFVQADSSITRKYGGSGLGTTIARELVLLMKGDIGFYPNKPKGTVFWFTLPLSPSIRPDFTSELHGLEPDELTALKDSSVLLAEDYPTNQFIAQRHLESVGCVVDLAVNGKEAVKKASENKYALILMDVQMPEMDGLEATKIIKREALNAQTPIIAMTASAYDAERQECIDNGMDDVIAKPIRKVPFLKTVSSWIRRSSS